MTVKELTLTDNYEIVHLGNPEAVISEPYCCDLLSICNGKCTGCFCLVHCYEQHEHPGSGLSNGMCLRNSLSQCFH